MEIASLEDLVPGNHLVRKLDEAIDMSFIYEEVKDLYSDFGCESIDPVVLIKNCHDPIHFRNPFHAQNNS